MSEDPKQKDSTDREPRVPSFADAVAFAQAVEEVTREEFLDAQRRVRPGASYEGHAEGLWGPWKTGGLLWLANRTDPQEVAEVFALVVTKASVFIEDLHRDAVDDREGYLVFSAAEPGRVAVMSEKETPDGYAEWSILELMGHRRIGGFVTEAEVGGIPFLRIDIKTESSETTQYYGKAAVYCLTPTTEAIAMAVAKEFNPPVHRYEIAEVAEVDEYDSDGMMRQAPR